MSAVISLVIGVLFGLALQKSGLGNYEVVVNQFRMRDFTMLKFMLTAVAVGAVGVFALRALGVVGEELSPRGFLIAALAGGAVLGAGMAIAGTCPGTVFAGIGQGSLDYLVPGVLGMVAGSLAFGLLYDAVVPSLQAACDLGFASLADLAGMSPWALVAVLVAVVTCLAAADRRRRKAKLQDDEKGN